MFVYSKARYKPALENQHAKYSVANVECLMSVL